VALKHPDTIRAPQWPSSPIDTGIAWVDYDVVSDEFLVYFGGKPVPAISSPLNAPGLRGAAVMFGLAENDKSTGEIVGVQVIPMLLGAVPEQPHWAVLVWGAMAGDYGDALLRERLPGFLDEVQNAFRQHWTPAPPMEEQLARMGQTSPRGESGSGKRARGAERAKSA
jgi:hypothetical protein